MNPAYPQADNPLILRYRGQPPALKNNKIPIYGTGGKLKNLIPNREIGKFLANNHSVMQQVVNQGFMKMIFPTPVMAYVEIYLRILEDHGIPTADGDNAYTMLQETWQDPMIVKDLGTMLGVIDDDRQILAFNCEIRPIKSEFEGALVYLWEMNWEESPREQRWRFEEWQSQVQNEKAKEEPRFNLDEIDDLFDSI